MMEFKSVPGYGPIPYKRHSNAQNKLRRWNPAFLAVLILLSQIESMPVWFSIITQGAIFVISILTFIGCWFAVFILKVLSLPIDDTFISPLLNPGNQIELISIFLLCVLIYTVNWPLIFVAYAGVNLWVVLMHLKLLIKQTRQKRA